MIVKKLICSAAITFAISGCTSAATKDNSTEQAIIYYIPLPITTYTAVTAGNIEKEKSCALTTDVGRINWIKRIQNSGSAHVFDKNNVRVKIKTRDAEILVDTNGVMQMPDGRIAFSLEAKSKLVDALEVLRKDSSCIQYDWLDD